MLTLTDLNSFLLKFILDIPSSSYLNVYRIVFYVVLAYISLNVPGKHYIASEFHHPHDRFSYLFASLYFLLLLGEPVAVAASLYLQSRTVS